MKYAEEVRCNAITQAGHRCTRRMIACYPYERAYDARLCLAHAKQKYDHHTTVIQGNFALPHYAPQSVCTCGHLGDGLRSHHEDHYGAGHGHCTVLHCTCHKFTWAGFIDTHTTTQSWADPCASWPAAYQRHAPDATFDSAGASYTDVPAPHTSHLLKPITAQQQAEIEAAEQPGYHERFGGQSEPEEHCPDCGARGERAGHQTCQYPQDHDREQFGGTDSPSSSSPWEPYD